MAGIQFGGLVSGFDTTSMVEQLMTAERVKVDTVYQKKELVEFQKKAYTAITDKYTDFVLKARQIFGVSNSISTSGLTRPSTMNSLSWMYKATSSNESIVSAKASSSAKSGNYELNITQLADNVKFASSENVGIDNDTKLDVNLTIQTKQNQEPTTIQGSFTVSELMKELDKVEGLSASYDANIDRVFISTTETGKDNFIQITDANNTLEQLKLGDQIVSGTTYEGKNAIVDFNGAKGIEFSSNNFNIQGIDFNIKEIGSTKVTVDVDIDSIVSKMTEFITEYNNMVDEIGKVLVEERYKDYMPLTDAQKKEMTEKEIELWEQKVQSGLLRNDSMIQKIQNELRSAIMMPIDLGDGKTISLSDFGISGKSYFEGGKDGALVIDEDKLRNALADNPQDLINALFATPYDSSLNKSDRDLKSQDLISQKRSQCGIFNRISDVLSSGMSQLIQKAGVGADSNKYREVNSFIMIDFTTSGSRSLLDSSITEYNNRITRLNEQLTKIEARYWKQFTAMEQAMLQMQKNSSIFSSF